MNVHDLFLFLIAAVLGGIGWQINRLRQELKASACQDIVDKFFRIVEHPEFITVFSSNAPEVPEAEKRKAAFCSMIFAFLEQIYVESSGGQLIDRLHGPWVEFIRYWLNQPTIKTYWGSTAMICPTNGFDQGFRQFVDATYANSGAPIL